MSITSVTALASIPQSALKSGSAAPSNGHFAAILQGQPGMAETTSPDSEGERPTPGRKSSGRHAEDRDPGAHAATAPTLVANSLPSAILIAPATLPSLLSEGNGEDQAGQPSSTASAATAEAHAVTGIGPASKTLPATPSLASSSAPSSAPTVAPVELACAEMALEDASAEASGETPLEVAPGTPAGTGLGTSEIPAAPSSGAPTPASAVLSFAAPKGEIADPLAIPTHLAPTNPNVQTAPVQPAASEPVLPAPTDEARVKSVPGSTSGKKGHVAIQQADVAGLAGAQSRSSEHVDPSGSKSGDHASDPGPGADPQRDTKGDRSSSRNPADAQTPDPSAPVSMPAIQTLSHLPPAMPLVVPVQTSTTSLPPGTSVGTQGGPDRFDSDAGPIDTGVSGVNGPAALTRVDVARLLRTSAGSELRVSTSSAEFGPLTIRTVLGRDQLSAHISTGNEVLSSAIATHLQTLQETLESRLAPNLGLRASVSVGPEAQASTGHNHPGESANQAATSQGSKDGSPRQQELPHRFGNSIGAKQGTYAFSGESTPISHTVAGQNRLDVRI